MRRRAIRLCGTAALLLPGVLRPQATAAAPLARHETVRGVVTVAGTLPARTLPEADVTITRGPDRAFMTTRTASDGSYSIDWPEGTVTCHSRFSWPG